jgi:branched-chain amino acid transport system substrate-binding protein
MFDKEGKDFKTQISKLLATQPDAIFLAGYGTAGGILIKQLREMSYNGEIFGIPEIVTTNTVEAAQEAMDKVIFPDYAPDYKAGEAAEFRAKYLSSFNKEPGADSLLAYEGARILLYAIEQTDGSKEAVRSYICTLSNFPGIMGPISVQNNEIQHFLVMREFIKGEKTLYTK